MISTFKSDINHLPHLQSRVMTNPLIPVSRRLGLAIDTTPSSKRYLSLS